MIVHYNEFSIEIWYIWTYIPLNFIYLKLMSIKINFSNKNTGKSSVNNVLFADEKFNINGLKKYISNSEYSYILDLLNNKDTKRKIITFCPG